MGERQPLSTNDSRATGLLQEEEEEEEEEGGEGGGEPPQPTPHILQKKLSSNRSWT